MGQQGFGNATFVLCSSTCYNTTRQNGTEETALPDDTHYLFLRNVLTGALGVLLNIVAIVFLAITRKIKGCIKAALISMSVNDLIFMLDAIGFGIPQTTEHPACWPILYLIVTTLLVSSYNTALLSAQNYIAVFHPFHCNIILTTPRVVLCVIGGWLAGYLLGLALLGINLPAKLGCFALVVMPVYGIRLWGILCSAGLIVSIVVSAKIMFKVLWTRRNACGPNSVHGSAVPPESTDPSTSFPEEYSYHGTHALRPRPRAWLLNSRKKQNKIHISNNSSHGYNLRSLDVLTLAQPEGKHLSPLTFKKRNKRPEEKFQSFPRDRNEAEINVTSGQTFSKHSRRDMNQFHEPEENPMLKDFAQATHRDDTADYSRKIYKKPRFSGQQSRVANTDSEDSGYQHYDTESDSAHKSQVEKSSSILSPHCQDKNIQNENHNSQNNQPLKNIDFDIPSQIIDSSKRHLTLTTICEANNESSTPGPSSLHPCEETLETAGQSFVVNQGKYQSKQRRFYTRPHSRPGHLPMISTIEPPTQLVRTVETRNPPVRSMPIKAFTQQNGDAVEEESDTLSPDSHVRISSRRLKQKAFGGKIWPATSSEGSSGSSGQAQSHSPRASAAFITQPQRQKHVVLRNTLVILTIWNCVFSFPFIVYTTYVAMLGEEGKAREQFCKSKFGMFVSTLVGLSGITNPMLYAWRFVEWRVIYRRLKQKIVGR